MIRYALRCDNEHEFDSWFRSSAAYDEQAKRRVLECPVCGSHTVDKALMAPGLVTGLATRREVPARDEAPVMGGAAADAADAQKQAMMMSALRQHVEATYEYVGDRFAEEARRIHYDEADARDIFGEVTLEEATELIEEGVAVAPLPGVPKSQTH